jgi:hypothetical protein
MDDATPNAGVAKLLLTYTRSHRFEEVLEL